MEKDRDGCPKIVNIGASRKDLSYERRKLGTSVRLEHCVRELTPLLYTRVQEGLTKVRFPFRSIS